MIALDVNDKKYEVDADPQEPLLWVLRERLKLTGTKFGCGIGMCGACTVHIDGQAQRSCQTSLKSAEGKKITTVEGLPENHPVKVAWLEHQVPQCGYCQPGQIMEASALLTQDPHPSEEKIAQVMQGNLCRCGTYPRIRRAVQAAAKGG
ncbi:MAG: (2Fe-2S)-binding protein [Proteobacteria bacterium]|nr:(2Fe-2S)-binding protein [Pseudomonadota bacterium]